MINWDELVESTITNIHFDVFTKQAQIEVSCIWGVKKNMRIIAIGINEFVINNAKLSNIIDRISIFESRNADEKKEEILETLFF